MRPWRITFSIERNGNDDRTHGSADRRRAGRGHFKDGSNISSFDGNATLDEADDEFAGAYLPIGIKLAISGIWTGSERAEQQQDQQHNQNQSAKAHAGMAHAIAIAAETA